MKRLHYILIVGGLTVISGGGYILLDRSAEPYSGVSPKANVIISRDIKTEVTGVETGKKEPFLGKSNSESERDYLALQSEVLLLRNEVSTLRNKVDEVASVLSERSTQDQVTETTDTIDPVDRAKRDSAGAKNLVKASNIEESFADQPRNTEWSKYASRTIRTAFDAEELSGALLSELDCRSTICRAVVQHDDPEKRSEFLERFPTTTLVDTFAEISTSFNKTGKDNTTIIYLQGSDSSR